jgi:hypothetical protein
MFQAVRLMSVTAVARAQTRARSCRIFGGQVSLERVFPSTSAFPCHCRSVSGQWSVLIFVCHWLLCSEFVRSFVFCNADGIMTLWRYKKRENDPLIKSKHACSIMFIIMPTDAQISSVKLLGRVSVLNTIFRQFTVVLAEGMHYWNDRIQHSSVLLW